MSGYERAINWNTSGKTVTEVRQAERIATLEQQNAELVAALECIAGYEHPFCTMPQDLQAIATEALSKVKQP